MASTTAGAGPSTEVRKEDFEQNLTKLAKAEVGLRRARVLSFSGVLATSSILLNSPHFVYFVLL
jgi:hypothetical protein